MRIVKLCLLFPLLYSCVSSKAYEHLKNEKNKLKVERGSLTKQLQDLETVKNALENDLEKSKSKVKILSVENANQEQDIVALKRNLKALEESHKFLDQNRSSAIVSITRKNKALLQMIEKKEQALRAESIRLEKLNKEISIGEKKINDLKVLLNKRENEMSRLKKSLSDALLSYKDKGLSIEQKSGKLYVSMENKLLFKSGSWDIEVAGRSAIVKLGKVLARSPNISILIEGHTDNVAYIGKKKGINGNWDLSTKRAVEVVKILEKNKDISLKNLTAAGRSEYDPVASNESPEGKAKNRRIEIIIAPNIDKILSLVE
ncbi:cell envelope biogenesis protein OmpA [Elysia marginata]|uniref:Cell envelope biogenesis protein OmpA n=1 Tax=Elysia marginata TaxID=1093978 RepID=A0AAV4G672_9GAST|nr:cell envelope biogenesis protein OmpA [Elysia marginata]